MRKKICVVMAFVICMICTAAVPQYTEHYISELDMTISLPSQAYVTGRKVARDFALLEQYDISAAQLEANYKTRNIYCNAVWDDGRADMTEIVVSMTSDDDTRALFDLSGLSDEQLEQIRGQYLAISGGDVLRRYDEVSMYEGEQALFIRAQGISDSNGMRENHLQYMTVLGGDRYTVTLIEHFGAGAQIGERSVSRENAEIMDDVIRSVKWDKVKKKRALVFGIPPFYIAAAVICLVLLDLYAVYALIDRTKKKDMDDNTSECIE